MNKNIAIPKDKVADFCRRHHIQKLAVFGSALGDDFGPDSDVDMLVEFEKDWEPGFMGLASMERELSSIIGWQADIRTPEDLSRLFRDEVINAAEVQYAQ